VPAEGINHRVHRGARGNRNVIGVSLDAEGSGTQQDDPHPSGYERVFDERKRCASIHSNDEAKSEGEPFVPLNENDPSVDSRQASTMQYKPLLKRFALRSASW